jgi:hypothetical protein
MFASYHISYPRLQQYINSCCLTDVEFVAVMWDFLNFYGGSVGKIVRNFCGAIVETKQLIKP